MKKAEKKNIMDFTVIFQPDEDGIYHVSVPALPGCVTFGYTLSEAQERAKEVIELWLTELAVEKKTVPSHFPRPWIGEIRVFVPQNVAAKLS